MMRCINCFVATKMQRRHDTSSLPDGIHKILARWLTVEVPKDSHICHACFVLLNSEGAGDVRLFGFTELCVDCGLSVKRRQRHDFDRSHPMLLSLPKTHPAFLQAINYACHRCWIRYQRQSIDEPIVPVPKRRPEPARETRPEPARETRPEPARETRPEPARETRPEPAREKRPEPPPPAPEQIYLPNYKRPAKTLRKISNESCEVTTEALGSSAVKDEIVNDGEDREERAEENGEEGDETFDDLGHDEGADHDEVDDSQVISPAEEDEEKEENFIRIKSREATPAVIKIEKPAVSRKRRKSDENCNNFDILSNSTNVKSSFHQNDDELFLLSFLSDMKLMNRAQKLQFKLGVIKLMKKIIDESNTEMPCSSSS